MPGFLFFVCWQQSDLYWHLGLNRQARTGTLLPVIGTATLLTLLRGLGASYLLGRCIGGIYTLPRGFYCWFFYVELITDILDGQIARRTQTQTRYGQIADGEADFCLYIATTCILIQENILPLWFGLFLLLRFAIPLFAAVVSYFLLHSSSTIWLDFMGKSSRFSIVFLLPSIACARTVDFSYHILTSSSFNCNSATTGHRAACTDL